MAFLTSGKSNLQLARDPLVVVLQRGGAQHDLFDPVGGGPAGGRLRLDADAPGGIAVIGDLLGQRHQLVPGGRDGVAGGVEVVLRVPHQALAVEAVPDAAGHGLPSGPATMPMSSQLWLYCCFSQSSEIQVVGSTI